MDREYDETEIDLLQLAKSLIKHWWVIALASVLAAAIAFSYTYFMVTPLYESSASFYVNSKDISIGSASLSISSSEISAAKSLVDTYVIILTSRTTLNEVIKSAELDYTYSELKSMISAASVNSTEIFEVTVTSPDPEEAEKIVNTIAIVLPEKVADIVDGTSVRIVDYGVVPTERSSPSYVKNTAIGFVLGFVLSCGVIIVRDLFDDIVRSEDYLIQTYPDLPLLAVIPDLDASGKSGYGYGYGYGYTEQPNTSASKKGGKK